MLLADSKSLVIQVVPRALLEFSRGVMRSRFSAIVRRQIYTFSFDRFSEITPSIYRKLMKARENKAIIMTTPNALKSFALKFVEVLHNIDLLVHQQEPKQNVVVGFFSRRKTAQADDAAIRIRDLQSQAAEAVRVMNLWKGSHLLMDEVDLILHPLKSELNYPLGQRAPLDFTDNKAGKGLRYELPFYLLDALYFATEGKMMNTGSAKDSRQMSIILDKLKAAVKAGQADRSIQRVPHFVILRKQFYTSQLQPLLAEWLLIWLGTKGLSGLTDSQILHFLAKGPRDPVAAKMVETATELNVEYVKMLNLSHDWLTSYLPHILTKIHRVGFGMLSWSEIEELKLSEPYLPKSRIYTAVPFVGKDVPSKASEFSHPG